jgi:lipoate-protein ligase B
MLKKVEHIDLGLVDYREAFLFQEQKLKERQEDIIPDTLIFCRHPSVVTLGRASKKEDLFGWDGEVVETNRGGRATYHGPGQIVVYPIVSLKNNSNLNIREQDVRAFLEGIENAVVKVLRSYGLDAKTLSLKPLEPGQLNRGIWVGDKKIASIGIAVKRWCTMHGVALNFLKDEKAFTGIHACGFDTQTYASMEELGVEVTYQELKEKLTNAFRLAH